MDYSRPNGGLRTSYGVDPVDDELERVRRDIGGAEMNLEKIFANSAKHYLQSTDPSPPPATNDQTRILGIQTTTSQYSPNPISYLQYQPPSQTSKLQSVQIISDIHRGQSTPTPTYPVHQTQPITTSPQPTPSYYPSIYTAHQSTTYQAPTASTPTYNNAIRLGASMPTNLHTQQAAYQAQHQPPHQHHQHHPTTSRSDSVQTTFSVLESFVERSRALSSLTAVEVAPLAQNLLPPDVADLFCRPEQALQSIQQFLSQEKQRVQVSDLPQVQVDIDSFLREIVRLMDQVRDQLFLKIEDRSQLLLGTYQELSSSVLSFMERSLDLVRK